MRKRRVKKRVLKSMNRIADEAEENKFFQEVLSHQKSVEDSLQKLIDAQQFKHKLRINLCPFCRKYTAKYQMQQKRSMDEGSTANFHCTNELCGRQWKGSH